MGNSPRTAPECCVRLDNTHPLQTYISLAILPATNIVSIRMSIIHIVFCISGNYEKLAAAAAMSAMRNTRSKLHFYILTESKHRANDVTAWVRMTKDMGHEAEFITCDCSMFQDLPNGWHWNRAHFLKFAIAELLPNLNRAIYLDADVILNRDIRALWETDLTGKPIAARYHQDYLDGTAPHFNSGVMLLDLRQWRRDDVMNSLIQIARNNDPNDFRPVYCADQTPLNQYFKDNLLTLDRRWNSSPMYESGTPFILHYYGNYLRVPWKYPRAKKSRLWWRYCRMTPFAPFFERMQGIMRENKFAMRLGLGSFCPTTGERL